MKYKQLILLFAACLLILSCKSNLETIQTLDEETGEKISYTRSTDTMAKQGLYIRTSKAGIKLEEAMYENDVLHGPRKMFYPDGSIFIEEQYNKGEYHGSWKTYHENGKLKQEGAYINNKIEGIWKGYYDNGQLKEEVLFKGNEENGPFIEYHNNGKLKTEGAYLDGDNEHGPLKMYDESGELIKTMDCNKGICRTTWTKEGGS
jgi:antitoxin component YwqK of YwqJK toxin-antitoxin module